jgi:hypothetical protein
MKRFTKTKEDFVCEHCGTAVTGDGYTNHCSNCLWSKHVDVMPGDRTESCQGLMEPIGLESKGGNYTIIHRCQKCKTERRNRTATPDNFEAMLALPLT